uniref:Uncharacterized protein n=1 Tax=Anguilla anguilla TaxID=7936 RepID=A0A0E9PN27_ANGAN
MRKRSWWQNVIPLDGFQTACF